MKRKWIAAALILCFALMLTACGKKSSSAPAKNTVKNPEVTTKAPDTPATEAPKGEENKTEEPAVTGFKKISDFSEAWNDLYNQTERAINNYEGMPIMALVSPGLAFATGVQYQLLNMEDKDGRFEGELMLAGYEGFIEKNGRKLTFGYEDVLEKDGFGPGSKAGDRKVENGVFEMDKEFIKMESFTERGGVKISRTYYEFKRLDDGSILCFQLSGSMYDGKGDENMSTSFVFIHNGTDCYDFAIAKSDTGPEFNIVSLENEGTLTKERAIEIFEGAGLTIDTTGGIKNDVLVVD